MEIFQSEIYKLNLPLPATQNHEERNHLGIKLFQIPKARNKSFVPRKQKIDEIPSYNSDIFHFEILR